MGKSRVFCFFDSRGTYMAFSGVGTYFRVTTARAVQLLKAQQLEMHFAVLLRACERSVGG